MVGKKKVHNILGILFGKRYDPGPTLFLTRLAVVNGIKAVSGSMAIFKQLLYGKDKVRPTIVTILGGTSFAIKK